jgi:hypothetical protein
MTEPGKNAPGLEGFPTPNAADEIPSYLLFLFPDSTWSQYILGACRALVYDYNWYEAGDLQPDEASEQFRALVQQAPYNLQPQEIPAPYWDEDTADDADDEMQRDTQIWYGKIVETMGFVAEDVSLTFLDNVGIFAIAGFIAYAGQPGAAIAFIPIAQRFTLAFKQNSLGGVVKALIDFAEVAEIDTYGVTDGVASLNVVMPDDGDPHTLYVMLSEDNPHSIENPSMTVIRKRLSESEVSGDPTKIRFNDDCECIQTSPDGGTTWIDNPQADPRHGLAYTKPPLGGDDARCDMAANRVKWVRDFIDSMVAALETAGEIFTIANIALQFYELLFGEAGLIVDLFFEIGSIVVGVGGSALDGAFTETVYDALNCLFFCNAQPDGSVDLAAFNALVAGVDASPDINTTAQLVLDAILGAQGENGVNNAGVIGGQTGDCSACADGDFCHIWGNGHSAFSAFTASFSGGAGSLSGDVWVGANDIPDVTTNLVIALFPDVPVTVNEVVITYSSHNLGGERPDVILKLAGTQVARIDNTNAGGESVEGAAYTATFSAVVCDQIELVLISGGVGTLTQITQCQISGSGGCGIFGVDNC